MWFLSCTIKKTILPLKVKHLIYKCTYLDGFEQYIKFKVLYNIVQWYAKGRLFFLEKLRPIGTPLT